MYSEHMAGVRAKIWARFEAAAKYFYARMYTQRTFFITCSYRHGASDERISNEASLIPMVWFDC